MAANSESQINLKTLQRVDANIIEIIDNASQVAIYKYDRNLQIWKETDIEGAMFLYRRYLNPCHGFIIVNRMNTTNFVECITSDMQFQLQEPYLLYKNHLGDIIGCWFYEQKDLQRISKKIQIIVLKQAATPRRQRCASESETQPPKAKGQDIMMLLSQAHKKYMTNVSITQQPSDPKEDPNNFSALCSEKKSFDKIISSFGNLKDSPVRSSSQEEYQVSPRRRFMSTGSFDPDRNRAFSEEGLGKIKNVKVENIEKDVCNDLVKDASVPIFFRCDWMAPTKLSPLFSHDEISSPVSDVAVLDQSFNKVDSEQHRYSPSWKQNAKNTEQNDWKNSLGSEREMHFDSMKQVLKSHIQDNPKSVLKIHEAYVSSLKSLFSRN